MEKVFREIIARHVKTWEKAHEKTLPSPEVKKLYRELDEVSLRRNSMEDLTAQGLNRTVAAYQRSVSGVLGSRPASVEFISLEGEAWADNLASRLIDQTASKMRTVYEPVTKELRIGYMSEELIRDYHWLL